MTRKRQKMENLDFKLHRLEELPKGVPFVEIQAGKGKKDDSSTYILAEEFTYIEGIIWDKHREYGMSRKSKINSNDWSRIMGGFDIAIKELGTCTDQEQLTEILQLRNHQDYNPLSAVFKKKAELIQLYQDFSTWLVNHIDTEKYILIHKKI